MLNQSTSISILLAFTLILAMISEMVKELANIVRYVVVAFVVITRLILSNDESVWLSV